MKPKGITSLDIVTIVFAVSVVLLVAIPNIIKLRCRSVGNNLGLNSRLVSLVCYDCKGCNKKNVTQIEALHMIRNGADPSRFIEWEENKPVMRNTNGKKN